MPDVRTFKAATMREALDRVRDDLGPDAVILSTRQVPARRLLPWGQREEVEITAGLGIATRPLSAKASGGRQPSERDRGQSESPRRADAPRSPRSMAPPLPRLNVPERRAAEIIKELQRRDLGGPFAASASLARSGSESGPAVDLSRRLDAIEGMLADLGRRSRAAADVSADLLGVYDRLRDAEVDEPVARDLLDRLRERVPSTGLADSAAVRTALVRLVEAELRCVGPIAVEPGVRKVVALVGPTGVGKTTTVAKLAANFRLRDGLRTGLVTVDTYRIAAVDQLRTYAEIIDLPMKVVTTAAEMESALGELAGLDLVLIDTAGRSPRHSEQIAELASLLAAARPDETHLVLSLAAGRKALAQSVERFRPVAPTSLIATKLDEADGPGALLALARDGGPPLSYLTTGQDVPDDIEPARPDRLARSIIGGSSTSLPDGRG